MWAITEKGTEADDMCFMKFPVRVHSKKKCDKDNREELQQNFKKKIYYRNRHYKEVQKQEDKNFPNRAFQKESGIYMIITFDWNLTWYLSRQNWYTTLHRLPLSPPTVG